MRVQRRLLRDYDWMSNRLLKPVRIRQAREMAGSGWREVFPAEQAAIARPAVLDDADWRVFRSAMKQVVPAGRLVDFNNAYVVGNDSWIFNSERVAVAGLWDRQGRMTEAQRFHTLGDLSPARFARTRFLPGLTLVLNHVFAYNFYHFTTQTLPRLAIAAQAVDIDRIDHFIVPGHITQYMRDLLRYAGIDERKLAPMTQEGFRCERLITTSNPGSFNVSPAWATDFIREIVPVAPSPVKSRRIFLSRADVPTRRLINHNEIETLLSAMGFEHVQLDGRPFAEQAAIFREAEIIVAVHGAALTNLIFAQPATRVIELLPRNHLMPCFWAIGQNGQLDYSIILGAEKPSKVPAWRLDVEADLTIPLPVLKAEVEAAISKHGAAYRG